VAGTVGVSGVDTGGVADALKAALAERRVAVDCQPQVSLADGRMVAVRAVPHWPSGDAAGPVTGLHDRDLAMVADERGLSDDLARAMIGAGSRVRAALRGGAAGTGGAEPRVSIPVTARQLADSEYPARLEALAREFGCGCDAVVLELSEEALRDPRPVVAATMARLRAGGVRLAIVGVGEGELMLAQLARVTVDEVRLAPAVVRSVATAAWAEAVVGAAVAIGRALGIEVGADGIEDEAQVQRLRGAGCGVATGPLWQGMLARCAGRAVR
jgi:EAL domain-containing protein (putative c-di-GMP-specific phosphodiesterase class I)